VSPSATWVDWWAGSKLRADIPFRHLLRRYPLLCAQRMWRLPPRTPEHGVQPTWPPQLWLHLAETGALSLSPAAHTTTTSGHAGLAHDERAPLQIQWHACEPLRFPALAGPWRIILSKCVHTPMHPPPDPFRTPLDSASLGVAP